MSRRRPVVLTCAVLAVLGSAGCGWPFVMEDAETPAPTTAAAPLSPAAPAPPEPVEVAGATLSDREDGTDYSGTLQVTRLGPAPGTPPMSGWFPLDCDLPREGPSSTTTVDVTFADTSRLGMASAVADVELRSADGTPPPVGAAVFVESSAPDARWCQDGSTTPTADGFGATTATTVSVYVVSRNGAPLTGVVLRISGFRNAPNAEGPWDRVTPTSGGCPGDPTALCVPLV